MIKKVLHLFVGLLMSLFTLGQNVNSNSADTAAIPYGNNSAAGKYYNIRGIKIYAEEYGQGRPLLMIHGNGGSGKSFAKHIPYFEKKYRVIIADSRSQGKSVDLEFNEVSK